MSCSQGWLGKASLKRWHVDQVLKRRRCPLKAPMSPGPAVFSPCLHKAAPQKTNIYWAHLMSRAHSWQELSSSSRPWGSLLAVLNSWYRRRETKTFAEFGHTAHAQNPRNSRFQSPHSIYCPDTGVLPWLVDACVPHTSSHSFAYFLPKHSIHEISMVVNCFLVGNRVAIWQSGGEGKHRDPINTRGTWQKTRMTKITAAKWTILYICTLVECFLHVRCCAKSFMWTCPQYL